LWSENKKPSNQNFLTLAIRFIMRFFGLLFGTALVLGFYAIFIEPQNVKVETIDFQIPGLPPDLDGFTIGVLADLHLGTHVSFRRADKAVTLLKKASPDVIVLAGDMIVDPEKVAQFDMTLSPLGHVYAVMGNWDRRYPESMWDKSSNITFLINSGVTIAPGLYLAGIDDYNVGHADLDAALKDAPENSHRILVSHAPDFADVVTPEDRISLVISGHSHGGQIRIPGFPLVLPPFARKYPAGLYSAPHCSVYTSRGVGTSHIPARFLCSPEVTLIRLRSMSST
jgi:predicted MPP superfamily phosphohydrolase